MDDKTEVVVFHDLAEVVVDNKKVLMWVGTQTYTIRHLSDEESVETTNSYDSGGSTNKQQTSSGKEDSNSISQTNYKFDANNDDDDDKATEMATGSAPTPEEDDDDESIIMYDVDADAYPEDAGQDGFIAYDENLTTTKRQLLNGSSNMQNNNNNNTINEIRTITIDDDFYEGISASDTLQSFSSTSSNDGGMDIMGSLYSNKTKRTSLTKIIDTIPESPEGCKTLCTICNKNFSSEYSKKRHQLTHFGIRPSQCPTCYRYFAQSSGYYTHKCSKKCSVSIKSKNKMLQCKACGKSFPGIYKLKRHEISHTGEKPYRCDVCQRAFTQWTGMNRHNCPKRVVDGEKIPPACDDCGKIFKNDKYLQIHRQTHKFDGRIVDDTVITDAIISADLDLESSMDFIREMLS